MKIITEKMSKVYGDAFLIICSFLQPLELCRARYLSSHHRAVTDQWLAKTYQTHMIQDHACPQCGKQLYRDRHDKYDMVNDPTFYDILYGDIDAMERSRLECVDDVLDRDHERRRLLCEDCDNEEIELNELVLPCKGSRKYCVNYIQCGQSIYSWAFLSLQTDKMVWNQIKTFLPQCDDYIEDDDDEHQYSITTFPISHLNIMNNI